MTRKFSLMACAALCTALAVLAFSACGDDGDGSNSDPTAEVSTGHTPQSAGTPFPQPTVTDTTINSVSKAYSATYPAGWRVRPNLVNSIDSSVDAIFEPLAPDAKVQANISVTCAVENRHPNEERIVAVATNTARLPLNSDIVSSTRTIDGQQAGVVEYTHQSQQNPQQTPIRKTDYVFAGATCDYLITTVTAVGDEAKYKPQFDAFIDSFRILD